MKIAILGWGSLIWQPKELNFDKEIGWSANGAYLPIEFSRISDDGRLTLVIDAKANKVQTLYAVSLYNKLEEAVLNLKNREGCGEDKIGWYDKEQGTFFMDNFSFKSEIIEWINTTDCDAVIWTNIGKRFKDKIGLDFNIENVIKYLEMLPDDTKVLAEQYIRKAPKQIKTPIRQEIEIKLNWPFIATKK